MANDLTSTPNLWILDTPGMLSPTPVWVRKIIFFPNAADDDVQFRQWFPDSTLAAGTKSQKTGTITSTNTLTSAGNLPSTVVDGSVFRIITSDGVVANHDYHVVETAGDTNAVVVHDDDWTNEATVVYNWTTYLTVPAMTYKAGNSDTSAIRDTWYPAKRFPNLTLEILDGGSLHVYLY